MQAAFILIRVNLFWDVRTCIANQSVVTTHVYPGLRTPRISVFSCDLYALSAAASAQASVSWVSFLKQFVLIFTFCILFSFFSLLSSLSCVWGLVQTDVTFRAQVSVRVANDSLSENGLNFHHRTCTVHFWHQTDFSYLLLTLRWCQETLQKCSFWMLSVYL